MQLKVKKNIGKSQLEVEITEKDDKEALAKATLFMQPDICGLCKCPDVTWESRKAKTDEGTFTYVYRRCLNQECRATSTLGTHLNQGGYFWKQWEIYKPKGEMPQQTQKPEEDIGEIDPGQIPF